MTPRQTRSASARSASYEVGYGKPPRHTQFRKGQSGNPGGRPPRPPVLERANEMMLEEAYRMVEMKVDGNPVPLEALRAVVRSQFELALKGNYRAQRDFINAVQHAEQLKHSDAMRDFNAWEAAYDAAHKEYEEREENAKHEAECAAWRAKWGDDDDEYEESEEPAESEEEDEEEEDEEEDEEGDDSVRGEEDEVKEVEEVTEDNADEEAAEDVAPRFLRVAEDESDEDGPGGAAAVAAALDVVPSRRRRRQEELAARSRRDKSRRSNARRDKSRGIRQEPGKAWTTPRRKSAPEESRKIPC